MFIKKGGSGANFEPAPAGAKACCLVDVVDMGTVTTKFGDKDMVRLVFQTPDVFEKDGKSLNYNVSNRYAKSLHDKASLTKIVTAILGRRLNADDYGTEGFDMEALIGKGVLLQIVHSAPVGEEGRIYANIESAMALPSQMLAPEINPNYVRMKDREQAPDEQQARDDWAKGSADATEPPF